MTARWRIPAAALLGASALGLAPAAADHRSYDGYYDDGYYDDGYYDGGYYGGGGYYDGYGSYDSYGRYYDDYDYRGRPPYCRTDHDHRIHHRYYYDYYPADRYYRSGAYVGVRVGHRHRRHRHH